MSTEQVNLSNTWGNDWLTMDYTLAFADYYADDYQKALEHFNIIVDKRPDEWFGWNFRGILYYLLGQYDKARADFEKALSLNPDTSFPYSYLTMLAFRETDLNEAQTYAQAALDQFNNPSYSQRITSVFLQNREAGDIFGASIAAYANLIFFNYQEAISAAKTSLILQPDMIDMYIVLGISYCNRNDYAAAENAFSRGIEIDPDFATLYLMRSLVYLADDNPDQNFLQSQEDLDMAYTLAEGDLTRFDPYIDAAISGELTCKNSTFYNPNQQN